MQRCNPTTFRTFRLGIENHTPAPQSFSAMSNTFQKWITKISLHVLGDTAVGNVDVALAKGLITTYGEGGLQNGMGDEKGDGKSFSHAEGVSQEDLWCFLCSSLKFYPYKGRAQKLSTL